MSECSVTMQTKKGVHIVQVKGSLDAETFPGVEQQLREMLDRENARVVMDCKHLTYLYSGAIGALIRFARAAQEQDGCLKLVHLSPRIRKIFEVMGFNRVLEVNQDLDGALRELGRQLEKRR